MRFATIAFAAFALAAVVPPPGAWAAPDPAELVFVSDGNLISIAQDGSRRTPLAAPPGRSEDYDPAWSPDGSALAFIRVTLDAEGEQRAARLLVSAPDGSAATPVVEDRRATLAGPTWSPDGGALAFARLTLGHRAILSEIVIVGRDGSGARTVVTSRAALRRGFVYILEPAWSPDGSTIAYTRWRLDRRSYFRPDLRAVGLDGRGDRLLARDASGADWSPDGSRIAYSSVRDRNGRRCGEDECFYDGELYVMDASGGRQVRLTRGEGHESSPDWSPDGRWIAFDSDRNYPGTEHPEIYSIRPDGGCLTWLTNGSAQSTTPAWRPVPGASGDPGACGAVGRPPLSELDLGPALSIERPRLYWLGPSVPGLIPSYLDARRDAHGGAHLVYDDCVRFDPRRCPPSVELDQSPVCEGWRLVLALGRGRGAPRRWRGAVVTGRLDSGMLAVLTGETVIAIRSGIEGSRAAVRSLRRAMRSLRPLGRETIPRRLPGPALPRGLVRRLRRAERLAHALGVPDAARRLRAGQAKLRDRLRLLEALRGDGRLHTVRCER
jgi:hypothetical protein